MHLRIGVFITITTGGIIEYNRVCDKTIEYIDQIPYFIYDKLFNWKNVYHVGVWLSQVCNSKYLINNVLHSNLTTKYSSCIPYCDTQ